jgi:pimeloyl-ACP methyl ester carboxylesterase
MVAPAESRRALRPACALGVARRADPVSRVRATLAALGVLAAACATPVGVHRLSPLQAERALESNLLDDGKLSPETLQQLLQRGLYGKFQTNPAETLALLREEEIQGGDEDLLFALAELSFENGLRARDRRYFLASALYAYAALFPPTSLPALSPIDPRYRLAFDLYERGLVRAFLSQDGSAVVLESGSLALPFGTLELATPPEGFRWAGYRLERFASGADFEVRGLRNRYRIPGIGAPLLAALSAEGSEGLAPGAAYIPAGLRIPVSALVRLDPPDSILRGSVIHGALEVYARGDVEQAPLSGRRVPLAFEPTAALAYTLEGAAIWRFELSGFFSGIFRPAGLQPLESGLITLEPYRQGKIPVVLVHGTASSPARWAELVNELENDPRISAHYQIWLFLYNTGNPVGYSGGLLRKALSDAVCALDPNREDPALEDMVVIGHSQGGLLAKLTAIDSGTRFWDAVAKVPFDQVEADPETRELLRSSFFFTPLPFVKRVVFVATPHRGSYLAGFGIARLISKFVKLPAEVGGRLIDVARQNQAALAVDALSGPPTSITNMTPGNRFLHILSEIPVSEGIAVNSIIAVKGEGPVEGGSDGVVEYTSAHVAGVESEKVVRSGHSTQSEPETIEEIRRILLRHAAQFESVRSSPRIRSERECPAPGKPDSVSWEEAVTSRDGSG